LINVEVELGLDALASTHSKRRLRDVTPALERAAQAGNKLAAAALRGTGDWETLPRSL
jgi:hypothetical protein